MFCAVGCIGFMVDAGGLALLYYVAVDPIVARAISAPAAVASTFLLNRYLTFADFRGRLGAAFSTYLTTQGVGFACNITVYTASLKLTVEPFNKPIASLALASGIALVINYLGSRFFVFASRIL